MLRPGKRLIKLSLLLLVLTAVMAAGYFFTLRYYEGRNGPDRTASGGEELDSAMTEEPEQRIVTIGMDMLIEEPPAEGTSNLIYCQEENGTISALVLEVWSRSRERLSYITIPADTGVTISAGLYRMLTVEEPEVPQMMRLSELYRYYEKDAAFPLGVPVAEELLDTEIDSFTVLTAEEFGRQFRQTKNGIWKLAKKAAKKLSAAEPEVEIRFFLLPGEERNAGYEADRSRMYGELDGILEFTRGRSESE